MVISPEIASKITDEEMEVVKKIESSLDSLILENSKNNLTYHTLVCEDKTHNVGHRILDEIKKMYEPHYTVRIDCSKAPTYILLSPKE